MTMRIIDKTTLPQLRDRLPDNIILIDKPGGWTSFDVVRKIKHIGRFKKVGHAGTLDPFATGLLVIGTGQKTRELTEISAAGKTYIARMVLGRTTDTYDRTGITISEIPVNRIDIMTIEKILKDFTGETEQYAPPFSAKKVAGVRLYTLARKGKTVPIRPHTIRIDQLKIMGCDGGEIELFIQCSKGTYVRSLVHDIGIKSGYGACVNELRRTAVGSFLLEQALQISEFEKYWQTYN
jgi:tRNA pseudouridine55 synthase